jgi:uncharacterized protein YegL
MQFKLEPFLNPYLPAGTTRVDAIVTATADGTAQATALSQPVVGLIIDMSGSMEGNRIIAAKDAVRRAIDLLDESAYFFVVAFSDTAYQVAEAAQATRQNKDRADVQVQRLEARGGTRMSRGLALANDEFRKLPHAIHYALFLTDGKNHPDDERELDGVLQTSEGLFQCDCRGVGTDWQPKQLQKISEKLLGVTRIIAEPAGIEADFRAAIQNALGRNVGDVRLRLWTPKSAKIVSVKQMSPEIVVLTDRFTQIDPQTRDFPTGAWGAESRDYYIAIELPASEIGDEMLACRPSLVYQEGAQEMKTTGTPIVVSWTDDDGLSARISEHVAHYTGQAELAESIQKGLEAREQGDVDAATRFLGRAAKLATESGNTDTVRRLAKVVDIVDAGHGTVRLKSRVQKADEMDLDLGSTRTARAGRRPQATEGGAV